MNELLTYNSLNFLKKKKKEEEETEPKIFTMKTTERMSRKLQVTLKGDKGAITYFLNKKFPPENKH